MLLAYETEDDYTQDEVGVIAKWFDDNIGAEYDMNEDHLVIFDLTLSEHDKVKIFEIKFREGLGK